VFHAELPSLGGGLDSNGNCGPQPFKFFLENFKIRARGYKHGLSLDKKNCARSMQAFDLAAPQGYYYIRVAGNVRFSAMHVTKLPA
jgi:hypothetical protein